MSSSFGLTPPFGHGRGYQWMEAPTVPAAGSIFNSPLSPKYRHLAACIVFTLTTSSTAASRYVTVEYLLGGTQSVWANGAAVTVTASSTQRFVFQLERGDSEWNTGTDVFAPLSFALLDGGGTFEINVANIQAADTLTGIGILWYRFPTSDSTLPAFGSQFPVPDELVGLMGWVPE